MDLSTKHSSDLLYATLSGEFSLDEAKRTFLQILKDVEEFEVKKVLIDGRAITGHPTTVERFYYGEFVAHAVIDLCMKRKRTVPKFSYVLLKPVLDGQRLGETVALNRGMNVKTFDDLDAALKWLKT